jgi:hypothetical protein
MDEMNGRTASPGDAYSKPGTISVDTIKITSPVDGSVYAERPAASEAEIGAADLTGKRANITVRFTSEQISSRRDKSGDIIEGDPKKIREISDVWTFERDVSSRDPNWTLVATGNPT